MRTQTILAATPHTDVRFVPRESLTDVSDMQRVIAALYFEAPDRLDTRPLWTDGPRTYFRVNWWLRGHVQRSAFLLVEVRHDGWRVYDCTGRAA